MKLHLHRRLLIAILGIILVSPIAFAQTAGNIDTSFGEMGRVDIGKNIFPNAVIGTSDGGFIVVGADFRSGTEASYCQKFDSTGIVDISYNASNISGSTVLGSLDDITTDAGGNFVVYSNSGHVMRIRENGALDTTFGIGGFRAIQMFDTSESGWKNGEQSVRVIKVEPSSGKIYLGGSISNTSDRSRPVIACLRENGDINTGWGVNGVATVIKSALDTQYLHSIEDLVPLGSGKVVAVGFRDFPILNWSADYWACRLHKDGSTDGTFSGDGVAVFKGSFNGNDQAQSMIMNPDGSFIFAGGGYTTTLKYDFTIQQISANGSLGSLAFKADFGSGRDDIAEVIIRDEKGRFVLVGNSDDESAICRFNADGQADEDFGKSGRISDSAMSCTDAIADQQGRILVVGSTDQGLMITRYIGESLPELSNTILVSPLNSAIDREFENEVFAWNKAFLSEGYEFNLDSSMNFKASTIVEHTKSTGLTIPFLAPSTKYYWRVRAYTAADTGSWSEVWSFTTKAKETGSVQSVLDKHIRIFPNPASVTLTIDLPWQIKQAFHIYNDLGQNILEGSLVHGKNTIDLNRLVPGMYTLQIGTSHYRILISKE